MKYHCSEQGEENHCTHLDLKLSSFMGKYFTLSDKSMCKCFILKTDDNLVNIKYRTLFGPCGLNANGCKYYIFIKPFYNHSTFLNEFEFLLVDTTDIIKLTDKWIMGYYQLVRGIMYSYYKFEYKTLQKNGQVIKKIY
jgi:hypothetical protein